MCASHETESACSLRHPCNTQSVAVLLTAAVSAMTVTQLPGANMIGANSTASRGADASDSTGNHIHPTMRIMQYPGPNHPSDSAPTPAASPDSSAAARVLAWTGSWSIVT